MKIGTIGTNFIVDRFIDAAKQVNNVEIIAVYSRSQESADAFAEKHDVGKAYCDLKAMMNDEEIDTIYVASPNSLHYEHSLMALHHGKHVINEKPFASNLKEFDRLVEEATTRNLMLWEAITSIYTPNLNIIQDNLDECGDIKLVTCNFSQYSSRYQAYKEGQNPNVFTTEFSGGALMDINIYNVHFAMYLFGKPNHYRYYPNLGANGIDTSGVLIFEYDDFIATLIGSKDSDSKNFATIQGDAGAIIMDDTSIGVCSNAAFRTNKGELKNLGLHQADHMTYEINAFEKMLASEDYDTCYELLDYSREVVEVLEKARKDAGIFFKADE